MECTITYTAIILGQELSIDFTAECYMANDSIGDYEYMGFRGRHTGNDYAELDSDITWEESLYDTWQNAEIKKLAESEEVINEILNQYEDERKDIY